MRAARLSRQLQAGLGAGEDTEPALKAQYEKVILRASKRASLAYKRHATVVMAAAKKPQALPDLDEVIDGEALRASARAATAAARRRMARASLSAMSAETDWHRLAVQTMYQIAEQQAGIQAERLVAQVRDVARATIGNAVVEGWTVPQTAAQLRSAIEGVSESQATMLARTDLIQTANAASLTTARQVASEDANPLFKRWLATADARTRLEHVMADGQVVPVDAPFSVGGVDLMYPGDPSGPDDLCINCRCTLVYQEDPALPAKPSAKDLRLGAETSDPEADPRFARIGRAPERTQVLPTAREMRRTAEFSDPEFDERMRRLTATAGIEVTMGGEMSETVIAATLEENEAESQASDEQYAEEVCPYCKGSGMAEDCGAEMLSAATFMVAERDKFSEEAATAASDLVRDAEKQHEGHPSLQNQGTTLREPERAKLPPVYDGKREAQNQGLVAAAETSCSCHVNELTVENPGSLVAAVNPPEAPPAEWFENPMLEGPTPLTVTDDGRIFGHLAEWGQCHTGFPDKCVTPPRGLTYDFFNLGVLETADGDTVRVGKVTVATGHASITASRAKAAAHYDNTGAVAAYVTAGEDEYGPWLAGAVKSDATHEQIRDLMTNGPSGDWREVRKHGRSALELVGVLSVPVQGFPMAALRASGEPGEEVVALIAGAAYSDAVTGLHAGALIVDFDAEIARLTSDALGDEPLIPDFDSRMLMLTEDALGAEPDIMYRRTVIPVAVLEPVEVVPSFDEDIDREVGYRVDFFRDHGYWPASPQSGAELDDVMWQQAQDMSTGLVDEPDSKASEILRRRLLQQGYLNP